MAELARAGSGLDSARREPLARDLLLALPLDDVGRIAIDVRGQVVQGGQRAQLLAPRRVVAELLLEPIEVQAEHARGLSRVDWPIEMAAVEMQRTVGKTQLQLPRSRTRPY